MDVTGKQKSVNTTKNPVDRMRRLFAILILLFPLDNYCLAADRQNLFDWYYSAVFGTGAYRIADRDVFVVTVPYEKTLREAENEKNKIIFTSPVTLGFYDYDFDSITGLEIPTDVATLTVLPGVYLVVPMSEAWTVKPFANLGYGKEFAGGEEALIYSAGARNLYRIRDDAWHIAFGSALYYAGNTRENATDLGFAAFEAAIDVSHDTDYTIDGKKLYLGGYVAVYLFSDLEFVQSDQSTFELRDQYEIGLTMSAHGGLDLLGVHMDRIGIGYLAAQDFRAWRLVFSFPY